MPPHTTVEEKDFMILKLIDEHVKTQKTNTVGLPVAHLLSKGFDVSDTNNALWRLKDKGVLKRYLHGWGFFEVLKDKTREFIMTSTDEAVHDDDFEAYEIEVISAKLAQHLSICEQSKDSDKTILHLTKDGFLYKDPREKFHYDLSEKGVPLRILRYFIDSESVDYENTNDVARFLTMRPQLLRTEIGKLRTVTKKSLGLGNMALIESKQNSGYRLNQNIKIIAED